MPRQESGNQANRTVGRPAPLGRARLVPENPLPPRVALLQVLILLGLPLGLLLLAKLVLRSFFPHLGY